MGKETKETNFWESREFEEMNWSEAANERTNVAKVSFSVIDVIEVLPRTIIAWDEYYRLMIWACDDYNDNTIYRWGYYNEQAESLWQCEEECIHQLIAAIAEEIKEFEVEVPEKFERDNIGWFINLEM